MTSEQNRQIAESAALIRKACGALSPKIAVVLGSGLGAVADLLEGDVSISYSDLPGFPLPGVEGHEGSIRIGTVEGTPVLFLKGRVHLYEGKGTQPIQIIVRTLKSAGIDTLFLTNAAGSLLQDHGAGSVVAITDHVNLTGLNPLTGPNDDAWGPRFPGMENAWDADLRTLLLGSANEAGVKMGEGVYVGFLGPTFETPAEIRLTKAIGGDLVGMSTVAENIVARHCGLRCVGASAVTNMAAGMSDIPLSHDQTLEFAAVAGEKMAKVMRVFLKRFGTFAQSEAA